MNQDIKLLKQQIEQRDKEIELLQSELKKCKKDFVRLKNRHETLVDNSLLSINILDREGNVLLVNNKAATAYGNIKENIIGKNMSELLNKKDADFYIKRNKELIDNKRNETYKREFILNSEKKHFIILDQVEQDSEGNGIALQSLAVDVTQSIKDIALKNEELNKYKNNLEKLVAEKTNELETTNEELQATNEELYDKSEIIKGQNQELKSTLQHLKETQAQLFQAEKMASLGILTAGVAHEINNPLNYIMGSYVGLLRHYKDNTLSDNPEQVGKLIEAMKIGIDRSSAIVQGLNQFSRKSDSYEEDCNVHEIIENSLTMLHNQIKHHITVEKDLSASDFVIKGNVGNLHQVFINVFGNAVQAIETEGKITVKTENKVSEVLITITDSGIGIPKENIEKLTVPFFTTKDPGKGTGLGLSITYNIIKEHKGKLEFESEEGQGTSVKMFLPKA